jgi:hypothetical protein
MLGFQSLMSQVIGIAGNMCLNRDNSVNYFLSKGFFKVAIEVFSLF